MIGISKLYCDDSFAHDPLRYGVKADEGVANPHTRSVTAADRRPVVVWSLTRTCNLHCKHCYTDSDAKRYSGELTTEQALAVIDDLARFNVPSVLFSGGEPLLREDFWTLLAAAREKGLRCVLSTNGTLLGKETAALLKQEGLLYVGISLDGTEKTHNMFRGKGWAFEKTVRGIRNSKEIGLKVSLRITLTQHNVHELDAIFDFIEKENIDRVCFYHLAYAGRGRKLTTEDLTPVESRAAVDKILSKSRDFHNRGLKKDILTVANHVDGVYVYLKLLQENPKRAEAARRLIEWNGGGAHSSGVGIGNIDFMGNVHADQFWQTLSFGNVKERPFSEIWQDVSHPVMAGLKNRLSLLKGRCGECRWKNLCGGSLRVRADSLYGDPWAPDPACYLTDEEISLKNEVGAGI